MIRKWRNINHLENFITGSIENDNIDDFKHYINSYIKVRNDSRFITKFLDFSIEKNSLECFQYLHEMGYRTTNHEHILLWECNILLIEDIYENLLKNGYEFKSTIKFNILKRILEPYKILDNRNRIQVAWDYIESGFIDKQTFEKYIEFTAKIIKDGNRFKDTILGFVREFKLNQLLK
jgi:hypothetical protein